MRLHWNIGLTVAAILGPIAAGLGVAPYIVDLQAYKPGMIEAVRQATGRELVIDGPMRLSVFPVPGIGAGTVHFANAVGAKGAQMIDVGWVAVKPSWSALLQGRVEVGTLTLYRPTIVLETDAEGRPNWEFKPGGNGAQPADAPSAGFHLALGRLEIVKGTITYTDPKTRTNFSAEDVTGGATVASFDGPFEIDARATVNKVPLKLTLAVGAPTPGGHKARLNLQVSSGELDFKGDIGAIALDTTIQGHLSVKTGVLSDFVTSVSGAIGVAKPVFDTSGAGRFAFDGDIDVAPDHLAARDFEVSMGGDNARGTVSLAYKPVPTVEGKLSLSRLDIGKWIKIFSKPVEPRPGSAVNAVKDAVTSPTPEAAAAKVTTAVVGPSPWSKVDADVSLEVAEALYNNDAIRGLSASFQMNKGVVTIPRLKASMPGGLAIDLDAAKGTVWASTNNLRETLRWLDIDMGGIPRGRLQSLSVEGKLATKAGGLVLSDGVFKLDGVPGSLDGTLSLKPPISSKFNVGMEQIDLDSYLPKSATTFADASAPAAPPALPKVDATAPSVGLKLDIKKLAYRGETLNGVTGSATWQSEVLKLDNIKVADAVGAKLGLKGLLGNFGSVPRFDLTFTVAAADTDRLLDYAGLPKFMNGKVGAGTASGSVAGTRDAVAVHDVAIHILDTDARVAGTLAFTDPPTFDFKTFTLQTPEASKFVAVASGHPMSGLGPITATGALKGSPDRSIFTGNFTVRGTDMNGTLDATLGKRPKLAARLNVPRTLDIDALLGIEDKSAPAPRSPDEVPVETRHTGPARQATPTPINLNAFRSFDASLIVSAKAMSMAALTVDYADLDATLNRGVLKINKLTGQFYKGGVDFGGTIDASGQALAIAANGSLLGMHVDELLRGTVGDNIFGKSSSRRITVDGKVDARSVKLTAKGVSAAELRESITGATTVSGIMRAAMAPGAQSFAQFATGIGSIFSNTSAFDWAVLGAFINRDNTVTGGVALGGGTVNLKDLTLQGGNTTAVINGSNRMADGTTNTTIRLNTANRGYVATMTGKLASPDLHAVSQ